jgi:hypothetical protein
VNLGWFQVGFAVGPNIKTHGKHLFCRAPHNKTHGKHVFVSEIFIAFDILKLSNDFKSTKILHRSFFTRFIL